MLRDVVIDSYRAYTSENEFKLLHILHCRGDALFEHRKGSLPRAKDRASEYGSATEQLDGDDERSRQGTTRRRVALKSLARTLPDDESKYAPTAIAFGQTTRVNLVRVGRILNINARGKSNGKRDAQNDNALCSRRVTGLHLVLVSSLDSSFSSAT